MCWAWGSLGARPLVWISVSTFLFPSFSSIAWPSAPERLRGFRSALKCSPCSWFPCSCFPCSSRSPLSPPLAKATETRLSDMATASSSASPSFLYKAFSFLCLFIYLLSLLLLFCLCRSGLLQWRAPFFFGGLGVREQDPT